MRRTQRTQAAHRGPGLFALALVLLCACGGAEPWAQIELRAVLGRADSTGVARVEVTVSAPDLAPRTLELISDTGVYAGTFSALPIGAARVFLAKAFDASGAELYEGAQTVDIVAGAAAQVTVTLQQVGPTPSVTVSAPHIDSLLISGMRVAAGGTLQLAASASGGASGTTLAAAWSASDGAGSFSAPAAFTTFWTAPLAAGTVQLALVVSDGAGAADHAEVSVDVLDVPAAPADLSVSLAPNAATLSWTEVPLAGAYLVAWAATPAGLKHGCATVLSPATSATCAELPSGANLYLFVQAAIAGVPGAWSDALAATIP